MTANRVRELGVLLDEQLSRKVQQQGCPFLTCVATAFVIDPIRGNGNARSLNNIPIDCCIQFEILWMRQFASRRIGHGRRTGKFD